MQQPTSIETHLTPRVFDVPPNAGLMRFPYLGDSLAALMPHVLAWLVSDMLTAVEGNTLPPGLISENH
jgi:hypothetical protein